MNKQWLDQLPIKNIIKVTPVGGGDVNIAHKIETIDKDYFLLTQPNKPANFYKSEIVGLDLFNKAHICAPQVIANGQINGDAYLILNYLPIGNGKQSDLGHLVAKLHRNYQPDDKFGFTISDVGVSVSFTNNWTDSWSQLFIEQRLENLENLIRTKRLWDQEDTNNFKKAKGIIKEVLDKHHSKPSLLHGDLWQGNYLFLSDGRPALIDPAAFYGDREFDLGVTTVFGGFSQEFYETYAKDYPLEAGVNERLNFYRLYYLMLHLNKFGESYYSSVQNTLLQIIN